MANKIREFFAGVESIWEAIPGYVKVFLYSVVSSTFGLWVSGGLDFKAVMVILFTNLGLYGGPKALKQIMRK